MNRFLFVAVLAILFIFADVSRAQETEFAPAVAAGIGLAAAALGYQMGSDRARRDDDMTEVEVFSPEYMKNFARQWNRLPRVAQEEIASESFAAVEVLPPRERKFVRNMIHRLDAATSIADSDMFDDAVDAECLGVCVAVGVIGGLAVGAVAGYYNNKK